MYGLIGVRDLLIQIGAQSRLQTGPYLFLFSQSSENIFLSTVSLVPLSHRGVQSKWDFLLPECFLPTKPTVPIMREKSSAEGWFHLDYCQLLPLFLCIFQASNPSSHSCLMSPLHLVPLFHRSRLAGLPKPDSFHFSMWKLDFLDTLTSTSTVQDVLLLVVLSKKSKAGGWKDCSVGKVHVIQA